MRSKLFQNIFIVLLVFPLCAIVLKGNERRYPNLTESRMIVQGDSGTWDANNVHTLSVVEANRGGYKYWGYYGLSYYFYYGGGQPSLLKAGLVRSNDLIHWYKYNRNPIIGSNCRWPVVVLAGSTFYMFHEEFDSLTNDSWIVMLSSKDGIHFGHKVVVVPREDGLQNQNPFVFFNKRDGDYYLAYYHGRERSRDTTKNFWQIMLRKSRDIKKLKEARPEVLLSSTHTIAAPSITFFRNKYYLLIESKKIGKYDNQWVTRAFVSNKANGKYAEVANSPVFLNNDACAFQYVFHNKLYIFYSHCFDMKKSYWELRMVRATR